MKSKRIKIKSPSEIKKELRDKLDTIFSVFIRIRNADRNGYVKDFITGRYYHWTTIQCGHFMRREFKATRWDEKNCQVQTVHQNIILHGNQFAFSQKLDRKYGAGTAEMLRIKSQNICKLDEFKLNTLIKHYTEKVIEIAEEKGLEVKILKIKNGV